MYRKMVNRETEQFSRRENFPMNNIEKIHKNPGYAVIDRAPTRTMYFHRFLLFMNKTNAKLQGKTTNVL